MKAYVLYGFDRHLSKRFICLVNGADIASAAKRLQGTAEVVKDAASPLKRHFDKRQECAIFNPDEGSFEDRARRDGRYASFAIASFLHS